MRMTQEENQQLKQLAKRMTPELMKRLLAVPTCKEKQEQAAVMILDCCARVMMSDDREARVEAYQLHSRITRWVWNHHAERSWQGIHVGEVL